MHGPFMIRAENTPACRSPGTHCTACLMSLYLVILYTVPVESSTGRSTGRGHGSVEKRVVAAQSSVGTRMP